jgi:Flp pilus assembly protein TadG
MKQRGKRGSQERGVVMAWFGILLFVVLGMCALAIDLSALAVAKGELQNAADAASLAAVSALKSGQTRAEAIAAAQAVAAENAATGQSVQLAAADVTFGSYDADTDTFDKESFANASAVRVNARRTSDAPGGAVGLFFAGIWGNRSADLEAEAVAAMRKRDIVIVQDITFSFLEEIEDAKVADAALVNQLATQALAGDRIGLVTFNEAATKDLTLTSVADQQSTILSAVKKIQACSSSRLPNCGGTHIAPGLQAATSILSTSTNAEKVVVLVSDGMPYPSTRRQPAIAAADAADQESVNIFVVTLTQEKGGGSYGNGGADAEFNAGLVRGYGKAYETADAKQLDNLLLKILHEMPIRLVE